MTALASFALIGFAAVVSAAAIEAATDRADARLEGRQIMIDAQYRLGMSLR